MTLIPFFRECRLIKGLVKMLKKQQKNESKYYIIKECLIIFHYLAIFLAFATLLSKYFLIALLFSLLLRPS